VCPIRLEDLSLVEEGVDQVWVVVEVVGECGVEDFQHHQQNFFNDATVRQLRQSVHRWNDNEQC